MHFLHSSGIVHRDLKSLNLLLDSKWNVKVLIAYAPSAGVCAHALRLQVSDFGLTKFREDMKGMGQSALQGSIHWTAPEVRSNPSDAATVV
jgi:serine/threonine protein kinase